MINKLIEIQLSYLIFRSGEPESSAPHPPPPSQNSIHSKPEQNNMLKHAHYVTLHFPPRLFADLNSFHMLSLTRENKS